MHSVPNHYDIPHVLRDIALLNPTQPYTVGDAIRNAIGSSTSFVIESVRSSIHWNICI